MKLKVPKLYSQRDGRWASDILGYNTSSAYTIGSHGCLISDLGMYVDLTPREVNEKLKEKGGYAAGSGNFIWSHCVDLGLNQVYQSPFYSDPVTSQGLTKMRSLLDEGRPLLTHIDFDPRDADDDQHWILVMGHGENDVFWAYDPWTGTLIDLDVYGGVRRCVYEWRAYDKILPKDDGLDCQAQLDAVRIERDRNWNWFTTVCDALGVGANVDAAVNEAKKLVGNDDVLVEKDKTIADLQTQIMDLRAQLTQLQADNTILAAEASTLTQKAADLEKRYVVANSNYENALGRIRELEKAILTPVFRGWKKALVGLLSRLP